MPVRKLKDRFQKGETYTFRRVSRDRRRIPGQDKRVTVTRIAKKYGYVDDYFGRALQFDLETGVVSNHQNGMLVGYVMTADDIVEADERKRVLEGLKERHYGFTLPHGSDHYVTTATLAAILDMLDQDRENA